MKQAIERLQALPVSEQDFWARFIIFELHDDKRWNDSTAAHADKLERLVNEILANESM